MTQEEIFNGLCDIIAKLDELSSECYTYECFNTGIELDWISQRMRDTLKTWQEEIAK